MTEEAINFKKNNSNLDFKKMSLNELNALPHHIGILDFKISKASFKILNIHSYKKKVYKLLAFVFAFACFFQHSEAGFFGVADGERLEDGGGVKAGDDLLDRTLAGRAFVQRLGRDGAA